MNNLIPKGVIDAIDIVRQHQLKQKQREQQRQAENDIPSVVKNVKDFVGGYFGSYQEGVDNLNKQIKEGRSYKDASYSPYQMGNALGNAPVMGLGAQIVVGGVKAINKADDTVKAVKQGASKVDDVVTIPKGELKKFVRNIGLVLEGKKDKQIIGQDKDLIGKLVRLDIGNEKYGLEHIKKHIKEGSISEEDIYRLAELINTATQKVKDKSKMYYGKSLNPLIGTLTAIVGDNEDIAKQITLLRLRKKQFEKIFSKSGGTQVVPSSNMTISQVPGTGPRNFPGPQTTTNIIPQQGIIDNMDELVQEARKYKSAEDFYQRVGRETRNKLKKALNVEGIYFKDKFEDFWKKATASIEQKLDSLNPTGNVVVEYDPTFRATAPLGPNITTLDKTMGKPADEMITIYRGVTKSGRDINPGDYVTTNYELAKSYSGTGTVISKKVKLSEILDDITEPLGEEYIYRPKK